MYNKSVFIYSCQTSKTDLSNINYFNLKLFTYLGPNLDWNKIINLLSSLYSDI